MSLRRVKKGTNIIPDIFERPYEEIKRYYNHYCCGASLAQTGKRYGIDRKVLERQFKKHGFKLRTRILGPFKEFNGVKYYLSKGGYYRGGKDRKFLHYAIYGQEVPNDCVLYFKDGNRENFDKNNLGLMLKKICLSF